MILNAEKIDKAIITLQILNGNYVDLTKIVYVITYTNVVYVQVWTVHQYSGFISAMSLHFVHQNSAEQVNEYQNCRRQQN